MMKKNKSVKRIICLVSITALLCGWSFNSKLVITKAETGNLKNNYIVMAEDDSLYDDVVEEIGENVMEENEVLSDNNILIAELTVEEAALLNKNDDIIVEEDFEMEANQLDDVPKEKKRRKKSWMLYMN